MGLIKKIQELTGASKADVKIECPSCKKSISRSDAAANFYICPECNSYFRVRTKNRIKMVADQGSFTLWFEDVEQTNPLDFAGYEEKLEQTKEKSGLKEGVTIGQASIDGNDCVLGVCDSRFLMGSMGSVYGEKIAASIEKATVMRLPVIIFCCSGGARMQEGIISLMQMAKTSAAVKRHSDAGLLYVTVLTDPTTGGVTASFAMLGDIILAEPGSLIGFAGPRVIEQTIGEKLPEGFQRAEFQLEHGFVDAVVERKDLKSTLAYILKSHTASSDSKEVFTACFDKELLSKYKPNEVLKERMMKAKPLSAWEKVKCARSLDRPTSKAVIEYAFDDFLELHGDRQTKDDKAVVGGIANLAGQCVTVIGIEKGNDPVSCAEHNFGMAGPEGYRKALRLMNQAEKFNRPIICFINTAGAYPGKEAEEKGQGEAIARNLLEMSSMRVPILSVFIGEGGSGGALALSVANEVWMLENATYSILSPEGFASILWKDGKKAQNAAEVMKITASDLKKLGVIERIIPEYGIADKESTEAIAMYIREHASAFIERYSGMNRLAIADERYRRFRNF